MIITTKRALSRRFGKVAFELAPFLAAVVGTILMLPAALGAEDASKGQGSQSLAAASADASSVGVQSADPEAQLVRAREAQLARAREQLEQAAREVAELSTQIYVERGNSVRVRLQRGVVGLQLDPASGHDGARVLEVSPGGPAADGGVRAGDLIVTINGTTIAGDDTAAQVVERLRDVPPNTPVRLQLRRGDKTLSVELTTQAASLFAFVPPAPPILPMPPGGRPRLPGPVIAVPPLPNLPYLQALTAETAGMELATLTPTLGKYFGTDEGVLVIRAPRDDAFQLQDGDVIVAIDGRKPLNGVHATRILASYQPGERITLKMLRQKRPVSLTITLPSDPGAAPR
jgi:S1-C subfamily serine protease